VAGPIPQQPQTNPVPPGVPSVVPPNPPPPPPFTGQPSAAPIQVNQTLNVVDGSQVPTVGETTVYEHVLRINNTSLQAINLTIDDAMALDGDVLAASLLQGQTLAVSFNTDYSADSQVVSTSANVGQATVRGQSVTWTGQIGPGQSLELRTSVSQTPTNSLSLNQPIRGQSITVANPQGQTLAVPPAQFQQPMLPPAQRVVQPPPPPVDPITGSRAFPETGFTVVNDDIWTYFVRRGGQRTFGAPLSRQFTLSGNPAQLFERGLLVVVPTENGQIVTPINLLEAPFLSFDNLGDVQLPSADELLSSLAPDPADPSFGMMSQEFVQAFAPESFDGQNTRFYSTYLGTVLFREAFFNGDGDPNLVPLFDLEIWGLPTSLATHPTTGDGSADPLVTQLRFQRGVMQYEAGSDTTAGLKLGSYLRSVMLGDTSLPVLAEAAAANSPFWAQYNPDATLWVDRPDELPDTSLVLTFEPDITLCDFSVIFPQPGGNSRPHGVSARCRPSCRPAPT